MLPPRIIYLSATNLADRLFLKYFFAGMRSQQGRKALVLHENPGTQAADAHFASKRIAAQLSEQMCTAMALPAAQRKLFPPQAHAHRLLHKSWQQLDVVVTQMLTDADLSLSPTQLIPPLAQLLEAPEVWIFPDNPMAALCAENALVADAETHARLVAAYAEEKPVIDLALQLAPARICNPQQLP